MKSNEYKERQVRKTKREVKNEKIYELNKRGRVCATKTIDNSGEQRCKSR